MRCPNCQTSNPPTAKFCMECGCRFLSCPNCQTPNFQNARFCIECGNALLVEARPRGQATQPLIESAPSGGARLHNTPPRQLSAPEERRVVTIMFADITGSTPLADRLEPEDMRTILAGYFNLMTQQIRRHGGTVEKYIGDAVMAVFGLPAAHEDDPDRAIRAALDMQAALAHFNRLRQEREPDAPGLQMRIGINTGEVAAPGTQSDQQDFLITGDAVNVAARLQQVAVPDTILVGERTYLVTRDVFRYQSLAPLQVKGKTAPLNAWVVQGIREWGPAIIQHPRGIEGLQAPLVGRALELTLMHATYARVRDARHSHLITLLGTPGVGKSRLIREFIQREVEAARCTTCDDSLDEPYVLKGRCPPYGEGITYWPLVEILRSLIQVRDGESGETLEKRFVTFVNETLRKARRSEDIERVIGVLLQSVGSGLRGDRTLGDRRAIQRSTVNRDTSIGGPQASLWRAFRTLLEAMAQTRPLILVIDDLQWADEALLDLLAYLAGHITDYPVLFLCIARPDFLERRREWGGGQPNFTTIILDALSDDETAELVSELLDTRDLPEVLFYTIQRRAEGNPFFVEEIVRMLIDQRVLVNTDGNWRIGSQNEDAVNDLASPALPPEDTYIDLHYILPLPRVPDTIQGVLAARVDLLSGIEKQVIQCAAIIGRTFWLSALLELTNGLECEVVLRTLEQLIQRDYIEESDKADPRPVVGEPAFAFKHILIRDVVHNNIPRNRRSQKHAQLAIWLEQRVHERQDEFVEMLAYHAQQALANWSRTRQVPGLTADDSAAEQPEELPVLSRAELVERTIRYLRLAGDNAYQRYYTIRAIQAYIEALNLLITEDADELTIARMRTRLGNAYMQRANADDAWREFCRALTVMKDNTQVEPGDLLCLYLTIAELATRWKGWFNTRVDMEEVNDYIQEGLKLIEGQPPSADQALFLSFQAMWYMHQVERVPLEQRKKMAEQALLSSQESLRIAEQVNKPGALWIALDCQSYIYNQQHRYLQAHDALHRRQTLQHLISGREELHDLYSNLGWAHQRLGQYATAASWYGQAWKVAQTMESPWMLLYSMGERLLVWYHWDRWREAEDLARNLLQASEQYQYSVHWRLEALTILSELAYRTGRDEEGDSFLRQYQQLEERAVTKKPRYLIGIQALRGEWSEALKSLRALMHHTEPLSSPALIAQLAEVTVIAGEPAEIQQAICTQAIERSEESGARKYLAVAYRARGRMYLERASWLEAEADFRKALGVFEELDLSWERGETLFCLGMLNQKRGQQAAREQKESYQSLSHLFFEQALGFFEALSALPDTRRVREQLTAVSLRA